MKSNFSLFLNFHPNIKFLKSHHYESLPSKFGGNFFVSRRTSREREREKEREEEREREREGGEKGGSGGRVFLQL